MLSEPEHSWRRHPVWKHAGTVAICAALVVGVIVAAIYTGSGVRGHSASHAVHKTYAPLLAAVTTTADSNSFDFTFTGSDSPGTRSDSGAQTNMGVPTTFISQTLTFDGNGVVNTDPYVTLSRTDSASSYGAVTLVVDDSDAWEFGAGDAGVDPGSDTGPGDPLSQFGQEVEDSIGTGEGGLAMMGLADPYGRLDLAENMITSATETGTGMVDGTAVTTYAVTINVENEAIQAGLSPEQQATIDQALTFLQQQGYTGTSELVSVDGAGYIREIKSTVTFASGASVVGDQTYSDFGCAGTVTPGDPVVRAGASRLRLTRSAGGGRADLSSHDQHHRCVDYHDDFGPATLPHPDDRIGLDHFTHERAGGLKLTTGRPRARSILANSSATRAGAASSKTASSNRGTWGHASANHCRSPPTPAPAPCRRLSVLVRW